MNLSSISSKLELSRSNSPPFHLIIRLHLHGHLSFVQWLKKLFSIVLSKYIKIDKNFQITRFIEVKGKIILEIFNKLTNNIITKFGCISILRRKAGCTESNNKHQLTILLFFKEIFDLSEIHVKNYFIY